MIASIRQENNFNFPGPDVEQSEIQEKIRGIVERVTYHDEASGWSVLKVAPLRANDGLATVTVHQTRVFAGATMTARATSCGPAMNPTRQPGMP